MNVDSMSFLACPQCTFNRFMPSWYVFILFRLAAVFLVARPRLDVVRVLAVAAALEVGYFYLWRLGVVAGYRRIDVDTTLPPLEVFGEWFSWIFQLGLIHAVVMAALARIGFYKVRDAPAFGVRRAFLLIPCFFGIHLLQFMVASATSSTGH